MIPMLIIFLLRDIVCNYILNISILAFLFALQGESVYPWVQNVTPGEVSCYDLGYNFLSVTLYTYLFTFFCGKNNSL